MKYTYARGFAARTPTGMIVIVPDQVAADQHCFASRITPNGRSFPVIVRVSRPGCAPRKARATLRGDLYGLHTTGTGDMVVSL